MSENPSARLLKQQVRSTLGSLVKPDLLLLMRALETPLALEFDLRSYNAGYKWFDFIDALVLKRWCRSNEAKGMEKSSSVRKNRIFWIIRSIKVSTDSHPGFGRN